MARHARPARAGHVPRLFRDVGWSVYARIVGTAHHSPVRIQCARCRGLERDTECGGGHRDDRMGEALRPHERAHVARGDSVCRGQPRARLCRQCAHGAASRAGVGHRQPRRQCRQGAAMGDTEFVSLRRGRGGGDRDDQFRRQPRWIRWAFRDRLAEVADGQL